MNDDKRFEDRLLSALTPIVERRAATTRVWTRPRLAAAGAAVTAGVIAVATPSLLGGAAYAVTDEGDGWIRVEINDVTDADGLEAALEEHGISAEVDYLPSGQVCAEPRFARADGPRTMMVDSGSTAGGPLTFGILGEDLTDDQTLVLVLSGGRIDVVGVQLDIAEGEVAPCEPVEGDFEAPAPPPTGIGEDAGGED